MPPILTRRSPGFGQAPCRRPGRGRRRRLVVRPRVRRCCCRMGCQVLEVALRVHRRAGRSDRPYRVPAGVVDPHRSVGAAVVDVEARNGIADGLADLAGKARDRSSAAHHDVRAVGGEVDITQVGLTLGGVRGARLGQRVVLPGVQGRGRLSEVDDEGPVPQLPRHRGEVADSGQLRPG